MQVQAGGPAGDEAVDAGAAVQAVVVAAATQRVVAVAAQQRIGGEAAGEGVIAGAAVEHQAGDVAARAGVYRVVAGAADDRLDQDQRVDPAQPVAAGK